MIRFVQDTVSMVTYGYDKVCAGYGVYGEPPEVHEAAHVDQRQHHAHQHLYQIYHHKLYTYSQCCVSGSGSRGLKRCKSKMLL